MNLAKISANGQITLPVEIRRALSVKPGDKVLFLQNQDGEILIRNASVQAIYTAQVDFAGVAEEFGVHDDSDVQRLVNEVRYGNKKD
jgi:AbrB family looped-hinge helix DNA binding protein